jgi:hypothetical protein
VAVKTIAAGAMPHELADFRKELQTLHRIAQRCDGVCKMFGHAEHGGRLYLVMKLYAGSLDEHLRQVFPPSAGLLFPNCQSCCALVNTGPVG